jgi:serine protease AprX
MFKENSMKNRAVLILCLLTSTAFAGTELKLATGLISTRNKPIEILNQHQTEWIVQFKKPILESDKKTLISQGFQIHSYLPDDALIVRGSSQKISALRSEAGIQAVVAFLPHMKLSLTLGALSSLTNETRETFIVSLFNSSEANLIQNKIQALNKAILIQQVSGRSIVVTGSRAQLQELASIEGVENIQSFMQVQPLHQLFEASDVPAATAGDYTDLNGFETGTRVMNFDSIWSLGITGQNQIVGMADTGLDSGDSKAIHQDFQGGVKSGYAVGLFGKSWADPMGHGTHVAGSVLGRGVASGGLLKGGAYSAQMVAQGMWSPILNNLSVPNNLATMFNQAYADGARVHTNSWGAATNFGAYEKMAAAVDEVMFEKQDMLILFAAGNSGVDKNRDGRIDANSIGTPGTSKNALTVGASENLLAVGGIQKKIGELNGSASNWPAAPITESTLSDNINGIAMFSSRGPTNDGRLKPEIVAPGTNILSVRSQQSTAEVLWGAYNQDYVFSGGTSMACPLAASAATLARQFLIEKKGIAQPTAALLKAFLLHTAFEMYPGQYGEAGASQGQELLTLRPNNDEGYGRVDAAQMLKMDLGISTMIVDAKPGLATGESDTATLKLTVGGKLQVNLVWTDAPGSVNASQALVNDLDLEVILPDGTMLSKNDKINNNAFISAQVPAGEIKLRVKAINVPMGKSGKQPYALVASVQ